MGQMAMFTLMTRQKGLLCTRFIVFYQAVITTINYAHSHAIDISMPVSVPHYLTSHIDLLTVTALLNQ